jgi:hypothetical protein
VGAALAAAGSAAALNPQPLPPKIAGIVRDACTGLPVAGATVSVTPVDPAERNPGPVGTGPLGGFVISGLDPGAYAFSVAAPGYDPVGKNPGPIGTPGGTEIDVTADPGPINLPANEAVNETILASVLIAPAFPPDPCTNPGPIGLPALSGVVQDGTTGLPIVSARETLTPLDPAEKNPGPSGFSALGAFAWPTLDSGGYTLTLTTRGYKQPGPNGIPITKQPGPIGFARRQLGRLRHQPRHPAFPLTEGVEMHRIGFLRKPFAAVAAAAAVLLVAAGVAYATIHDGNGVIHGCYPKSGGNLAVIDASVTNCPRARPRSTGACRDRKGCRVRQARRDLRVRRGRPDRRAPRPESRLPREHEPGRGRGVSRVLTGRTAFLRSGRHLHNLGADRAGRFGERGHRHHLPPRRERRDSPEYKDVCRTQGR